MHATCIVSDPKILSGAPVLVGTRVPLARIVFLLQEGYTVEAIHNEFPHVPVSVIRGALTELVDHLGTNAYAAPVR